MQVMGMRAECSALGQLCHFVCHHLSDGQTVRSALLPNCMSTQILEQTREPGMSGGVLALGMHNLKPGSWKRSTGAEPTLHTPGQPLGSRGLILWSQRCLPVGTGLHPNSEMASNIFLLEASSSPANRPAVAADPNTGSDGTGEVIHH